MLSIQRSLQWKKKVVLYVVLFFCHVRECLKGLTAKWFYLLSYSVLPQTFSHRPSIMLISPTPWECLSHPPLNNAYLTHPSRILISPAPRGCLSHLPHENDYLTRPLRMLISPAPWECLSHPPLENAYLTRPMRMLIYTIIRPLILIVHKMITAAFIHVTENQEERKHIIDKDTSLNQ